MVSRLASVLLVIAVTAAILPPGYAAYIGAYIALFAALIALAVFGWSERATFAHPTAVAILGSIVLTAGAIPFVYHGPQDVLAPVLILPMLATIALGLLARPAYRVPSPTIIASICLTAALIALIGGGYEHYVLGIYRPGLGNNAIHYASLAAFSGALALIGVAASDRPMRYLFLLGPIFGLGAGFVADSRGPMIGAISMSGVGLLTLAVWLRRERLFVYAFIAIASAGALGVFYLVGSGNSRMANFFGNALNIFRFTGGSDDIRAALYASALEVLRTSPIVGVGLGQIMDTAQTLYPNQRDVFTLENLHADWANFAAMAGGMGLLAWLILLAAPLLVLCDSRARQDRVIVLGTILLSVGQLTLGISNATFGILPQTTIYAVALGYLLMRARRLAINHAPAA